MQLKKMTVMRQTGNHAETYLTMAEDWSADGSVKQTLTYEPDKNIVHKMLRNFDSKGRLLEQTDEFSRESVKTLSTIEYNDAEKIRIERQFYDDGGNTKTVYKSDSNNNLSSIEYYDDEEAGSPSKTSVYTYGGKGEPLDSKTIYEDGAILEQKTWLYSPEGKPLEIHTETEGGEQVQTLNYDENGVFVGHIIVLNGAVVEEVKLTILDGKLKSEKIHTPDTELERRYDEQGRLYYAERQNHYHGAVQSVKLHLEFDAEGRVITETHADTMNLGNNFTDQFNYEYYPEAV